jgi:hypothetical protein
VLRVSVRIALERKCFEGPPTGERIAARKAQIAEIEANLDKGISTDSVREEQNT